MIDTLRFRYRLRQLRRKRREWARQNDIEIAKAKKQGDREAVDDAYRQAELDDWVADDGISDLITQHLLELADKRLLPRPPRPPLVYGADHLYGPDPGPTWVQAKTSSSKIYLSDHGIAELRALIRRDTKERYELMLPWLSLAIGLVGALTGLAAVLVR